MPFNDMKRAWQHVITMIGMVLVLALAGVVGYEARRITQNAPQTNTLRHSVQPTTTGQRWWWRRWPVATA